MGSVDFGPQLIKLTVVCPADKCPEYGEVS